MSRRGLVASLVLLLLPGMARAQAPEPPADPEDREPEIVGAPAAFGVEEERVAVPAGTPLREAPDARSGALLTIDAEIELTALERLGTWTRVRYGGYVGWVRPGGPAPGGVADLAPVGSSAARFGARQELRSEALARIEGILGPPDAERPRLGPWILYTDLGDGRLLEFLDRVVAELPDLYRERYGLDPGPVGHDAVVLFAEETGYRAFAEEFGGLVGIAEGGHTGFGLAALYAGSRDRAELASLVVHELTHLLNARALGPRTPPWLEEGLANDLGFSEIGRQGRLEPGTLGGREERDLRVDPRRTMVVHTTWEGGLGALATLRQRLQGGSLPPVQVLVHLPWRELIDPAGRPLLYAESAFLVRYLLDREPEAFRSYLGHFASGGTDDPRLLLELTGADWAALHEAFGRWLLGQASAHGLLDPA